MRPDHDIGEVSTTMLAELGKHVRGSSGYVV